MPLNKFEKVISTNPKILLNNLVKKTWANIFTSVRRYSSSSSIWMFEHHVASGGMAVYKTELLCYFAKFFACKLRQLWQNYTSMCCMPINLGETGTSPLSPRYACIASFVLSKSWFMVFACVWQPGNSTTSETSQPASSFSMTTVNFLGIMPENLLRYINVSANKLLHSWLYRWPYF